MNDSDFLPVSVVMKDGSRLLGYGIVSDDDYLMLRGALEYMIDEATKISMWHFDPASDDLYMTFSMDDVLVVNSMSDQFLSMFRNFHNNSSQFDLDDLDESTIALMHDNPNSMN